MQPFSSQGCSACLVLSVHPPPRAGHSAPAPPASPAGSGAHFPDKRRPAGYTADASTRAWLSVE